MWISTTGYYVCGYPPRGIMYVDIHHRVLFYQHLQPLLNISYLHPVTLPIQGVLLHLERSHLDDNLFDQYLKLIEKLHQGLRDSNEKTTIHYEGSVQQIQEQIQCVLVQHLCCLNQMVSFVTLLASFPI